MFIHYILLITGKQRDHERWGEGVKLPVDPDVVIEDRTCNLLQALRSVFTQC
jgi:hypothetical protein